MLLVQKSTISHPRFPALPRLRWYLALGVSQHGMSVVALCSSQNTGFPLFLVLFSDTKISALPQSSASNPCCYRHINPHHDLRRWYGTLSSLFSFEVFTNTKIVFNCH